MDTGRHIRLISTGRLKRWLLLLPILLCVVFALLLSIADGAAAYALLVVALVGGALAALAVLPVGEGPPGPSWWTLLLVLLWLPGFPIVLGRTGVPFVFGLGCVAIALMAYAVVAAVRIMRRRETPWRSIVDAPWRP